MPRLFVLSAPSGAGKTTLCRRLVKSVPELAYSVSYTTRPPRAGEVDGVDYSFVSRGHFDQSRTCIEKGGVTGRRLEFLLQEMNREVNTLGSKSGDVDITKVVIDLKSELEKLREQVQNIE